MRWQMFWLVLASLRPRPLVASATSKSVSEGDAESPESSTHKPEFKALSDRPASPSLTLQAPLIFRQVPWSATSKSVGEGSPSLTAPG
jgi:hypothetical protein